MNKKCIGHKNTCDNEIGITLRYKAPGETKGTLKYFCHPHFLDFAYKLVGTYEKFSKEGKGA